MTPSRLHISKIVKNLNYEICKGKKFQKCMDKMDKCFSNFLFLDIFSRLGPLTIITFSGSCFQNFCCWCHHKKNSSTRQNKYQYSLFQNRYIYLSCKSSDSLPSRLTQFPTELCIKPLNVVRLLYLLLKLVKQRKTFLILQSLYSTPKSNKYATLLRTFFYCSSCQVGRNSAKRINYTLLPLVFFLFSFIFKTKVCNTVGW